MIVRNIFNFLIIFLLVLTSLFFVSDITHSPILAASVSWDGGAGTGNWGDALNWSTDTVPNSGDDVLIDLSTTVNISAGTTVNSLVLGNSGGTTAPILNFAYDSVGTTAPLVIDEGDITVYSGGKITHSAGTTAVVGTININIQNGDFNISNGASIDATGKGYQASEGAGAGTDGSGDNGAGGGAYGGNGGNGESGRTGGTSYGSITNPTNIGSGGGNAGYTGYPGGAGGGLIKIVVGELSLEGNIYANGGPASARDSAMNDYTGGGGSGGGVNLTINTITGAGSITANGTAGYNLADADGGGGSGGRIAINYSTNTYTGTITTNGGLGPDSALNGAAGTVYLNDGTGDGNLIVSTSTVPVSSNESNTPISGTFDDATISGYAAVNLSGTYENISVLNNTFVKLSGTLTLSNTLSLEDSSYTQIESSSVTTYNTLSWTDTATIADLGGDFPLVNDNATLTIPTGTTLYSNVTRTYNSVTVSGIWSHWENTTIQSYILDIDITNDLTISSGGSINVTGKGYQYGEGTGAGTDGSGDNGAGGGAYGGNGGNGESGITGGVPYGSILDPTSIGSAGGYSGYSAYKGGHGGGLVKIIVGGELDLQGNIYANGGTSSGGAKSPDWYAGGGGSGGGINLTVNTIKGSGNINANGSSGFYTTDACAGGGSGGRIAINYSTSTYTGGITTNGGSGPDSALNGAAGTIYLNDGTGDGNLIVSTSTVPVSANESYTSISGTFDDVTISGYAVVGLSGTLALSNTLSLEDSSYTQIESSSVTTYNTLSWTDTATIVDLGANFPLVNDNATLTIPTGTTLYSNVPRTYNSVTVSGTWSHWENTTIQTYILDIDITNDLTISSGGSINVTGKGYQYGEGPGAGTDGSGDNGAGGGAYGGNGGNGESGITGGVPYGSILDPTSIGSAGGYSGYSAYKGGYGGGLVKIIVGGELDLQGNIYANGGATSGGTNSWSYWFACGGGSGGGVNLTVNTITGSGNINANGGSGHYTVRASGGGGGGGRVAIYYSSNTYTGTITTNGGSGPDTATDGEIGTIYQLATNSTPVASASNILTSTYTGNLYAGNTYTFESIYSDVDGQEDLDKLYFRVDNPNGDDIEVYANNSATDLIDQTAIVTSGNEYISDATYSITPTYGTGNEVKVIWTFDILWNWIESSNIEYGVKAVDLASAQSTYSYTDNNYLYENDLTFTGSLVIEDSESNVIGSGSWTPSSENITLSGLTVVYENTTDIYPLDSDFNVTVTDTHSGLWVDGISSGQSFELTVTSYSSTSTSETLSIDITDIPSGGSDVSSNSFGFKVDATNPSVSSLSSSTHSESSNWYSTNIVRFVWEVLDLESGIENVYRYLSNTAGEVSTTVRNSGVQTALTEWTSEPIADGIWYFYLLVEDIVGNITLEDVYVKIDTSIPNIVDVTGNYENVWQNVSNKPVISWSDPNSLSDDIVYITVDGTTPSSSNFAYATNQRTYSLPEFVQGEHTIKVIPKNGAGTYGIVRNFLFKYDFTPTDVVTNFSASINSQNRVTLQWENPSDSDFTKVLVKRDTSSLMNTAVTVYEGTGNTLMDSNLKESTKYYYTVVAYDITGNISGSVQTNITTKDLSGPSAVTNFNGSQSEGGILLSWENPKNIDFEKVTLYRNSIEVYSGSSNTFFDTISSSGEYTYSIVAYDISGNSSSRSEITIFFEIEIPKDIENKLENPKVVETTTGESVEIRIPVEELLRGNDIGDVDSVRLIVDDKEYTMKLSKDGKFFTTTIDTPDTKGTYTVRAEAIKDGEVVGEYNMHLEVSDNQESNSSFSNYKKYIYIAVGVIFTLIAINILFKVGKKRKAS